MTGNWVEYRPRIEGLVRSVVLERAVLRPFPSRVAERNRLQHEQFRSGLSEPPLERPPRIKKLFKMVVYFLLALWLVSIVLGGHH